MPKRIVDVDLRTHQGDDNRCGGYCMDVLLYELDFHQQFKPGNTYKEMQLEQRKHLIPNSISYGFVTRPLGTEILLPSTLALRAASFAQSVQVFIQPNMNIPPQLIQEETDKIHIFAREITNNGSLVDHIAVVQSINNVIINAPDNTFYFVVLANDNGTYHWNLIKKESGKRYYYNTDGIGWRKGVPDRMMGIAIEVKPKN